ncbi:hypothetical protein WIW90_07485 [Sulfolobaceae archaeon RB850M]
MSIDLTNERDVVEDFIGEIPFNILVLANYNFYTLVDEIKNAFNTKYLIELLPSDVILLHIFNEKIKIGNLMLNSQKPSIIIAPYYVIKTLKEWDLLLHYEKIGKEEIVVLNTEDPCGEEEIIVNGYDISSRLFKKKLIAMCGKENNVKIVNGVLREFIKSSKPIVVYSNEVNDEGKRKITHMNIKVDFYISLFKNSSKLEIEGYESVKTVLNKVFTEINKI